jgi:hypothetical protein
MTAVKISLGLCVNLALACSGVVSGGGTIAVGGQSSVGGATGGNLASSGGTSQAAGGTASGGQANTGGLSIGGHCDDLVETNVLQRWTSGASDVPPAVTTLSSLGPGTALMGQQALRAVTNAGFDFWLRYGFASPADARAYDELRFAIRGLNTTPYGWQGNFPVVVVEDAVGARQTYTPTSQLLNSDGTTWIPIRVPIRGSNTWLLTGGPVDVSRLAAIELHADTWDTGFTLDLDAMSFEKDGAVCPCPVTCSKHGQCAPETYSCQCDLGYSGSDCSACAENYVTTGNGNCGLPVDGSASVWPNSFSKANSDGWLMAHHAEIAELDPKVIVLNFANPATPTMATTLVNSVIAAFAEASRAQGYRNSTNSPQLKYQLAKLIDLRDGVGGRPAPPAGYPYDNSTLYPAKGDRPPSYDPANPPVFGTIDYAALFSAAFAHWYGYPHPSQPGQFLDLCTLVDRGEVHELWLMASGDKLDAGGAEVLETKPLYTVTGNRIESSAERCAGNGCFDSDVPFCGRSLRIGFLNYNRGPGCYMESLSHGLESAMNHRVAPSLSEWFARFAGFDLDVRYGLPFSSWYGLGCPTSPATPCLYYPTSTSAHIVKSDLDRTLEPFDAVCGNVHYPPNGQSDYDINNAAIVESSCADFGGHSGPGGVDQQALVKSNDWMVPYGTLAGDCDGPFLVWWWQNMPSYNSGKTFADGRPMQSVWPFLYY